MTITKFKWISTLLFSFILLFHSLPAQAESANPYLIKVKKETNQLILYKEGVIQKVYPVATGRSPEKTPEGTFTLVTKFIKPGWKSIPGGVPENPLGERWLGIRVNGDEGRTYGIHGTNDASTIGSYVSSGCIRMYNGDVIELYNIVPTGTPVQIEGKSTSNNPQSPPPVKEYKPKQVMVQGDLVNIRTAPSLQAPIIQVAYAGSTFTAIGKEGDWLKIKLLHGQTAYLQASLARTTTAKAISSDKGIVNVPLANIRSTPSLEAPVLERVAYGTPLTLKGKTNGWYTIKMKNGSVGYIHSSLVHK